jgi:riboflavin biosynthesis pyrimidine reductase
MMGGAGIIASFLDEGEIDEFVIHVIPKFIGEGIPLIAPRHRSMALTPDLLQEVHRRRGQAALCRP